MMVRNHTKPITKYEGKYVTAGGAGLLCPCMPCFRVHDFGYWLYGKLIHRYHCWTNYTQGCPDSLPRPKHIFLLTKRFQKRKNGDTFRCLRCRQKVKIGVNDCDWVAITKEKSKKEVNNGKD